MGGPRCPRAGPQRGKGDSVDVQWGTPSGYRKVPNGIVKHALDFTTNFAWLSWDVLLLFLKWVRSLRFGVQTHPKRLTIIYNSGLSSSYSGPPGFSKPMVKREHFLPYHLGCSWGSSGASLVVHRLTCFSSSPPLGAEDPRRASQADRGLAP